MVNLLLLAVCFLLGIILGRMDRLPADAPRTLNAFIINIALPALTLLHIHDVPFKSSMLFTPLMPWVIFGIASFFFVWIGRWLNLPSNTVGCLILVGGLGNTSFVGLPMIEALYGREAVGIGVLADQPGSFLVLSTVGLVVAARYASGAITLRDMFRRVLRFPPFLAMLLAAASMAVPYPDPLRLVLGRLGDTLAPLALVSVGMQLKLSHLKGSSRRLMPGLLFKMFLAPMFILLLYWALPGDMDIVARVTVFEAAMPPMISAGIIAMEHDLDPALATLMLGIGIPLSFLLLPLWWYLMELL